MICIICEKNEGVERRKLIICDNCWNRIKERERNPMIKITKELNAADATGDMKRREKAEKVFRRMRKVYFEAQEKHMLRLKVIKQDENEYQVMVFIGKSRFGMESGILLETCSSKTAAMEYVASVKLFKPKKKAV